MLLSRKINSAVLGAFYEPFRFILCFAVVFSKTEYYFGVADCVITDRSPDFSIKICCFRSGFLKL